MDEESEDEDLCVIPRRCVLPKNLMLDFRGDTIYMYPAEIWRLA